MLMDEDEGMDDEEKNSLMQSVVTWLGDYKFAFMNKGASLIYIGLSRQKNESVSFLRKQLEMIHLQLMAVTSRRVIEMLRLNPSFDLMAEMLNGLPLVRRMSQVAGKSCATFLNMFQPLKRSEHVQDKLESVMQKYKPQAESFYFGLVFANFSVVAIIKSSQTMLVQPADINLLTNFMVEHSRRLKKRAPCFFSLCVPGLTEEFKMTVFFHTSNRQSG